MRAPTAVLAALDSSVYTRDTLQEIYDLAMKPYVILSRLRREKLKRDITEAVKLL